MPVDFNVSARIRRMLPAPQAESSYDVLRAARYNELFVNPLVVSRHVLSDEGSYFVATNPTPGTALLQVLTTGFLDTTPALYMHNGDSPSNAAAKRVYLDYIKFIVTTVPASTTQSNYTLVLDNVARTLSTDNTSKLTPKNTNMDSSSASVVDVLAAQNSATASVIAASSQSKRIVARGALGGIPILGDELVIQFGSNDVGSYGATAVASRKVSAAAPVILGPNHSLVLHQWWVGNAATAGQYEIELGWWER
jgi:hypothetical protein